MIASSATWAFSAGGDGVDGAGVDSAGAGVGVAVEVREISPVEAGDGVAVGAAVACWDSGTVAETQAAHSLESPAAFRARTV